MPPLEIVLGLRFSFSAIEFKITITLLTRSQNPSDASQFRKRQKICDRPPLKMARTSMCAFENLCMDFYRFLYRYLCAILALSILLRPKPPGIVMASTEIEDDMTTNANLLSLTPHARRCCSSGAKTHDALALVYRYGDLDRCAGRGRRASRLSRTACRDLCGSALRSVLSNARAEVELVVSEDDGVVITVLNAPR